MVAKGGRQMAARNRHSADVPMKRGSKLTPKGAKIVAALERFRDAIEVGTPIAQCYTVQRVKLDLTPRMFGPDEVKRIRAMIGVSQPIFGQFLGVDVKTVRSWEQGRREPSGMACRFLEEIQASPEHWRSRLDAVLRVSDRYR
jgi:putative transcriptional regulator